MGCRGRFERVHVDSHSPCVGSIALMWAVTFLVWAVIATMWDVTVPVGCYVNVGTEVRIWFRIRKTLKSASLRSANLSSDRKIKKIAWLQSANLKKNIKLSRSSRQIF